MSPFRPLTVIALGAALLLAACAGGMLGSTAPEHALNNISLIGSPNDTRLGKLNPRVEKVSVPLGGRGIAAAFRASGCGEPAPDFERMMRSQAGDGLRVPDGITLFDAGIGHYASSKCGARSQLRAVGVYGARVGTYELVFFGGQTRRVVTVR
jgi:hypothetical protein